MPVLEQWLVKDAKGRLHRISRDEGGYSGTENLAWWIPSPKAQPYVVHEVLKHIEKEPELGEWGAYAWLRL